jgi:putative hydrolase of the HAD superfamily
LALITKGDLMDQERKIADSGLRPHFQHIEVVSRKTQEVYEEIFDRLGVKPVNCIMVGNSLRSDILPILDLGGAAVYVPYETIWMHESAEEPVDQPNYYALEHLGQLPALLERLNA